MAMLSCYTFDAEKRPTAREISDKVSRVIHMIERDERPKKKNLLKIFDIDI